MNIRSEIIFNNYLKFFMRIFFWPSVVFIMGCIANFIIQHSFYLFSFVFADYILTSSEVILKTLENLILFWCIVNFLVYGKRELLKWVHESHHKLLQIIVPNIINSLQIAVFFLLIRFLIPQLGIVGLPSEIGVKITQILFILSLGFIFFQLINLLEKIILNQYLQHEDSFGMRKIQTQLGLIKRIVLSIGLLIILSAILMSFESVKNVGASILTTAGLISAVFAFASQQSLSRLFAGLQLAFTQPIRIGDTIIIDNEVGEVEEITLSYVVIKLWDLRRLIKPTDDFTSKGLQNLTRESTELLGTIYLYTDYTLPVDEIRNIFFQLLSESPLWDKKVSSLDVTDITEKSLQIRALMSAEDASKLWKLRCYIREKLVRHLVEQYPHCLSVSRTLTRSVAMP